MKALPGVWFPTCEQVARHCLDVQPPNGGWNVRRRHALERPLHDLATRRASSDAEVRWPDGKRCCRPRRRRPQPRAGGDAGIRAAELSTPVAYSRSKTGSIICSVCCVGTSCAHLRGARSHGEDPWPRAQGDPGRGHEIAAEAFRHEDAGLSREEEKARLDRTTAILSRGISASRAAGWFCSRARRTRSRAARSARQHDRSADRGRLRIYGNGLADDLPHYWVTDFAAGARSRLALLLSLRRPVFLHVPGKGTGPRKIPTCCFATGAGIRRAVQARPPLPHGAASAAHGLAASAEDAGGFPRLDERPCGVVEPDGGDVCHRPLGTTYPAATHLESRAGRSLEGLSGEPQLNRGILPLELPDKNLVSLHLW